MEAGGTSEALRRWQLVLATSLPRGGDSPAGHGLLSLPLVSDGEGCSQPATAGVPRAALSLTEGSVLGLLS